MSCPPGISSFLQAAAGSEGGSTTSESRSSRAEVESEKGNSKTSLSSRKDNAGKSQPVDLTQVATKQFTFVDFWVFLTPNSCHLGVFSTLATILDIVLFLLSASTVSYN